MDDTKTIDMTNTTHTTDKTPAPETLSQRFATLKSAEPKLRIRDAALRLGVTEAQLVALGCGAKNVRLNPDPQAFFHAAMELGRVMALTRNDHAVHERKGPYTEPGFFGPMGQVAGKDIDLRLFLNHWKIAFAVNENDRRSLQFFDAAGHAVHKLYLEEESDASAFERFVENQRDENQSTSQSVEPVEAAKTDLPDDEIDRAGLVAGWRSLQDTHEFHSLLKKHKVGRRQALRLAEPEFAVPVDPTTTGERLLHAAAASEVPIMVFVGNHGCIQIHTGPVQKIVRFGDWINVLDEDFNLHLRDTALSHAWVVRKPTKDGTVTSVELFDQPGNLVVQFFGARKPGKPELEEWRTITAHLEVAP